MIEESEDIRERRAIEETEQREQVRTENVGSTFRDGIRSAILLHLHVFLCRLTFVWLEIMMCVNNSLLHKNGSKIKKNKNMAANSFI